jgi:transcriptional regulator with XRE-family HTH domain
MINNILLEARHKKGLTRPQVVNESIKLVGELGAYDLALSLSLIINIERKDKYSISNIRPNDLFLLCKIYDLDFVELIKKAVDPRLSGAEKWEI